MKYTTGLLGAAGVGLAAAVPLERRQGSSLDVTVLQFALTLEHLENKFYADALKKFSEKDFAAAGYPSTYYEDLRYIASDEQSHVAVLTAALSSVGVTPVQPCTYTFPYTDVKSFITLSSIVEGVGTSAYLGGAPLISNKDYLAVAGSILVTEALHTSYQRAAIAEVPFANAYGTALDPTSVFTLAAGFITSCPAGNAPLPFVPYRGLSYDATASCSGSKTRSKRSIACRSPKDGSSGSSNGSPSHGSSEGGKPNNNGGYNGGYNKPPMNAQPACEKYAGDTITLTLAAATGSTNTTTSAGSSVPAGSFVTFVSGLAVTSVPAGSINGASVNVAIPAGVSGQTYVFLTSAAAAGNKLDSTTVVAGPAIVEVTPPAPVVDLNV